MGGPESPPKPPASFASALSKAGEAPAPPRRSGTVAIIGRPNVGKSTILNAALEQQLSIVSPTPQTTRDAILGVVHRRGAEIALLDTPGLHRARSELGRVMNQTAREAAREADVVVFVVEVPSRAPHSRAAQAARRALAKGGTSKVVEPPGSPERADPLRVAPHPGDLTLLSDIAADKPTVLVVNKVDRAHDKSAILPLLEAYGKVRSFAAVIPISALRADGVARVLDEVATLLPEGPWVHGPEDITDRPVRFFAAEYVREQILAATEAEVPHAVAVVIERFLEPAAGPAALATHIDATICVERPGQKRILIGTGGEMLKRIGTQARLRIQELTGGKVNLKLWVRVVPAWRQERAKLEELGYRSPGGGGGQETVILAELPMTEAETETETEEEDVQ
jgi:GTPase